MKKEFDPATVSGKRSAVNRRFKSNPKLEALNQFADWMVYELPPGPPVIPMRVYVNLHKGGMAFYILALMVYYDNFTLASYAYLLMHGSYGFFWLLKDFVFPDPNFGRLVTVSSFLMPWPIALIPYMMPAFWIVSERVEVSVERAFCCIGLYMFGVVIMLLTDAQKYLVLREKRGLITHAMMGWSRNMNYCGEITLYAAFGLLSPRWEIWFVYSYMWGLVFVIRMLAKDYSLSRKDGWRDYYEQTWMLLPKLFNSNIASYLIYIALVFAGWFTYSHGGIEQTLKMLL